MPTSWDGALVRCPFYRENDRQTLRCEGPWPNTGVAISFRSPLARRQHMEHLCQDRFCRCTLYRQVQEKYETQGM